MIHEDRTRLHAGKGARISQHNAAHVIVVSEAREHEVGVFDSLKRRFLKSGAVLLRPLLSLGDRTVINRHLKALFDQMSGHGIAHHAEPQKRAFDRHLLLSFSAFNLSVFGRLIAPVPQVGQRLFDGLVTLFGDAAFV